MGFFLSLRQINPMKNKSIISVLLVLLFSPILLVIYPNSAFAQSDVAKSLTLPEATVTAEKVTRFSEYDYVMMDFELVNDKFFILQREKKSMKNHRVLVTNMLYDPVDTIQLPTRLKPTHLEFDIAKNVQIVTQDSLYQILEIDGKHCYGFPVEKKHYREVMHNCLFMTDRYVYFCNIKADGYLMSFYRVAPQDKSLEVIFNNNDLQNLSEIPDEVAWHEAHQPKSGGLWFGPSPEDWEVFLRHVWMRPNQAYLGCSNDTLYYFDHKNRKIVTYDEDLNLLRSCDITYPDKETFWHHTMYQDRVSGKFYTIFGTVLNEINTKTGKTIPKTQANSFLSQKLIIYKGNLYSLKKKRDSGNIEVSYIEKTKLN